MQAVRGSIPDSGATDFCTLISFVYLISCIVLLSVSHIHICSRALQTANQFSRSFNIRPELRRAVVCNYVADKIPINLRCPVASKISRRRNLYSIVSKLSSTTRFLSSYEQV